MSRTANRRLFCRFSHGMAEHSALYKPFCEYMAQRGFVVVINDHLGHGRSVTSGALYGHFGEGGLYNVVEDQRNLQSIMRENILSCRIFSWASMGSFIAREFAAAYGNSPSRRWYSWVPARAFRLPCGRPSARTNMLKEAKGARAKIPSLEKIATGPYNKKFKPNRTNYDWVTSKEEEVDRFKRPAVRLPAHGAGVYRPRHAFVRHQHRPVVRRVPKTCRFCSSPAKTIPWAIWARVRRVFDKLNKTGARREADAYPRIRHALITEMNSAQVYEDLYAFFSSHLPKAEEPVYEKRDESRA